MIAIAYLYKLLTLPEVVKREKYDIIFFSMSVERIEETLTPKTVPNYPVETLRGLMFTLGDDVPKTSSAIPIRFSIETWFSGQKKLRVVVNETFFDFNEEQRTYIMNYIAKIRNETK